MYETREFKGYFQSREVVEVDGVVSVVNDWRFYLCGFAADSARILLYDKTTEQVPIDADNRIFVAGKWFSQSHWDH
ncbi:hypothetical protein JWZ98_22845 (plasmid) [Methylomonas sp. EFPC1]|uniref:hypothetical protein n=1 Tax=Methylomonas sp. EFPC1 TaxID=2812647 RepID=UPI001967B090|nr:hypothetical protein [Methylomonas sp. EFPC1]QSB03825.1 hypothetical protein JWZ98_22845 [Methylomonas sp. EFPC1]